MNRPSLDQLVSELRNARKADGDAMFRAVNNWIKFGPIAADEFLQLHLRLLRKNSDMQNQIKKLKKAIAKSSEDLTELFPPEFSVSSEMEHRIITGVLMGLEARGDDDG